MNRIPRRQRSLWFEERYHAAAPQVIETFGAGFISLTGKTVADIGCGDGIVDLGVFRRVAPARLVGFDILPTDPGLLSRLAAEEGLSGELPEGLEFQTSPAESLTSEDATFDLAFSWSAFHYLQDPAVAIRQIHRVLKPGGALMIQLYPFFHSPHGSLLHDWYPEGFAQLSRSDEEMAAKVRSNPGPDPAWAEHLLWTRQMLNRLTLDELGEMLAAGGFQVVRLQLIAEDSAIPPGAAGLPLSQIGVGGVKLLAERD